MITAASARWPRRRVANAPSPPSSSPITPCTASGRSRRTPPRAIVPTATLAAKPRLHVAGTSSVEPALEHLRGERVTSAPGLRDRPAAPRRDGPEEPARVSHRPRTPRPARTPGRARLPPPGTRIGAQLIEVDLPVVHLQAGVGEHAGGHLDHLDLARRTGHRRHPHERRQPFDERVLVDVPEDPLLGRGQSGVAHGARLAGGPVTTVPWYSVTSLAVLRWGSGRLPRDRGIWHSPKPSPGVKHA